MNVNPNTFLLAPSSSEYQWLAELINPLISGNGMMAKAGIGEMEWSWDLVPLVVEEDCIRFILKKFMEFDEPIGFIGVEISGDIYAADAAQSIRWFTFHKPDTAPVYHATPEDAAYDRKAWMPPAYNWKIDSSIEQPGHMQWPNWRYAVRKIENTFQYEGVRHDDWVVSPGRSIWDSKTTEDKIAIICSNTETGQHIGFLQTYLDTEFEVHYPFIIVGDIPCFFTSVKDALAFRQDLIIDSEIIHYTELAVKKWVSVPKRPTI